MTDWKIFGFSGTRALGECTISTKNTLTATLRRHALRRTRDIQFQLLFPACWPNHYMLRPGCNIETRPAAGGRRKEPSFQQQLVCYQRSPLSGSLRSRRWLVRRSPSMSYRLGPLLIPLSGFFLEHYTSQ